MHQNLLFGGREKVRVRISPEKLLSDLLKRQARSIGRDITECPSLQIPAHLARLRDCEESISLVCRHGLCPPGDSVISGRQLISPATLADWLAVLHIVKREHRLTPFANVRDGQLTAIEDKIDLLAKLVADGTGLGNGNGGGGERSDSILPHP